MKNKPLSAMLVFCLLFTFQPAAAHAQDKDSIAVDPIPCVKNADCTAALHEDGCPLYQAPSDLPDPKFETDNDPVLLPDEPIEDSAALNKDAEETLNEEQAVMNRLSASFAKTLTIAPEGGDFTDMQAAFNSLEEPINGSVLLLVKDDLPSAAAYHVPTDKGITSLTIATDNPRGVEISGITPVFYAGGIPLVIDDGVAFLGEIFGGSDRDLTSDTHITIQEGAKVSTVYGGGQDSTVTGDITLTIYGQAESIIGGGCAAADASAGDKTATADVFGHIHITLDGENAQLGSKLIGGGIAYSLTANEASQALQADVHGGVSLTVNCPNIPSHAEIYGGGYAYLAAAGNRSLAANVTGDIRITLGSNTQAAAQLLLWGGGYAAAPGSASDGAGLAHFSAAAVVTGDITLDASENMYMATGREDWEDAQFAARYGQGFASGAQADAAVLGDTTVSLTRRVPPSEVTAKTALILTDAALEEALNGATAAAQYDVTVTKAVTKSDSTSTTTPVTQLSTPIKLVFNIPSDLQTAPSGFNRSFIMLRTHDNATVALPDEDNDPSTYTVSSNLFSTYTLAYRDTPTVTPPTEYPVTLPAQPAHGQLAVSPQRAASGTLVTITAIPDEGFVLDAISATDSAGLALTLTRQTDGSYTFVMPASSVTLAASFAASGSHSSSSSSSSSYPISLPAQVANGHIAVSPHYAVRGRTVTLTLQPDAGYTLGQLSVTDSKGTALSLTHLANGKVTFTMPAARVSVSVSFVKQTLPFTDVHTDDWFYQAVAEAYEQGLMGGTSPSTFAPEAATTRGMLVTILYRLEGEPAASGPSFDDVADGQYYAPAISWASVNGIVVGYDASHFGPDEALTREQLAAVLYRYADYKGYATTGRADLTVFRDAAQISPYAQDVLAWANARGLITGMGDGLINPAGYTTRAQTAAILLRFTDTFPQ